MAAKKGGCAIVTGSNQGIGLEIARGLARYMPTVMTSRDTTRGREAMEKLLAEEPGLDLAMQQLDITDDDSVDRFVAWTESHYDGVAVLVNKIAAGHTIAKSKTKARHRHVRNNNSPGRRAHSV